MKLEELQNRFNLIEKEINSLNQAILQAQANLNVLLGGKQEVQFWIDEVKKGIPEEKKENENG